MDAQGNLTLGWEDLTGGGDSDFNDMVVTVSGLATAVARRRPRYGCARGHDGNRSGVRRSGDLAVTAPL